MVDDFGDLISQSIFELNLLKKKTLKPNSVFSRGLLCDSKKMILDNYLTSVGNMMVLAGSTCQLLLIMKTTDDVTFRMANAKKLFRLVYERISSDVYKTEHCSGCPKSAVLFGIMQSQLEDIVFEEITQKIIPFIGAENGQKLQVCEEILDIIYDFAESALFHLSGLRIRCTNIKSSIYNDERFPISGIFKPLACEELEDPLADMPPSSCLHKDPQKKECLHMFLHDDVFKVKKWLDVYVDLYKTYHKFPKKVNIVFDYKMVEENTKWAKEDNDRYLNAKETFGRVHVVNAEHIDFGEYDIKICDLNKIEECATI